MKRSAARSSAARLRGAPLALLAVLVGCGDSTDAHDAGAWWGNTPVGTADGAVVRVDGGATSGGGGDSSVGSPGGNTGGPGGNTSGGNPGAGNPGGNTAGGQPGGRDGGMDASTTPSGDGSVPAGGGGCALRPNKDGWIANASNGAHVQGAVYTYASTGSTIVPLTNTTTPFTTGEGGKLCVKGEAAKVLNMEFSKYYGAGLAFDLCQADSMVQTKYPIGQCPLGKGLVGINYKLSGATIPIELRVTFHEAGRDESTYVLAKDGQNEARFADGKVFYNAMAPAVNVDKIDAVQFAIPTNEVNTTPFDFCVEDVQFVMAGGMSCAGGTTPTDAGTGGGASDGGVKDSSVADSGGTTMLPPITNGCQGETTRYWDCCKPHCGSRSVVSSAFAPITTCNTQDAPLSNFDTASGCGNPQGAFMCHGNTPWAVSSSLAFGFAAVRNFQDVCGRCYQLQFTGQSSTGTIDPGSAALAGKTMVIQASNIGTGAELPAGKFGLPTPGAAVAMFNGCSSQWGTSDLGKQYGGFLSTCQETVGRANHAALKNCVMQRCTSVFGSRGLTKLEAGCRWYVEWFEVADNPTVVYKEVACPQELRSRGLNRQVSSVDRCIPGDNN